MRTMSDMRILLNAYSQRCDAHARVDGERLTLAQLSRSSGMRMSALSQHPSISDKK